MSSELLKYNYIAIVISTEPNINDNAVPVINLAGIFT